MLNKLHLCILGDPEEVSGMSPLRWRKRSHLPSQWPHCTNGHEWKSPSANVTNWKGKFDLRESRIAQPWFLCLPVTLRLWACYICGWGTDRGHNGADSRGNDITGRSGQTGQPHWYLRAEASWVTAAESGWYATLSNYKIMITRMYVVCHHLRMTLFMALQVYQCFRPSCLRFSKSSQMKTKRPIVTGSPDLWVFIIFAHK